MSDSDQTDEEQRKAVITTITLDISNKHLKEVPKSIKNFTNIEFLYLSTNDIKTIPGSFFHQLPQLKWLDFRHNQLAVLPPSIGDHRELRTLLLQGNNLTRLPIELGNVPTITGLNIADNPLDFPPKTVQQEGTQKILRFLRVELQKERLLIPELTSQLEELSVGGGDNEGYLGSCEEDYNISVTKKTSRRKTHRLVETKPASFSPSHRSATLQPRKEQKCKWSTSETLITTRPQLPKARKKFKSANPITRVRHSEHYIKKAMQQFEEKRMLAIRKEENSRTEMIVQRMRDREALKQWRQENTTNQSSSIGLKEGVLTRNSPLDSIRPLQQKHAHVALTEQEIALRNRIKEHASKLREYHKTTSASSNLQEARVGVLQEADQRYKQEYRFKAFTGELAD